MSLSHAPRPYGAGRRFSIYWAWSYPGEANRPTTEIDNRFSTMTEVRRVAWPAYESLEWSASRFLQGIDGTLELFHLSLEKFQGLIEEVTGHPARAHQRVDQAGHFLPLDERILDDTDTLMVFGLDHLASEQKASEQELTCVRRFSRPRGEHVDHRAAP